MNAWGRLFELGRRQEGVVAVRQVADVGLSPEALRGRARREAWRRPHRGVYVLPGVAVTWEVRAWAALLAVGDHATLTGESALYVLGVSRNPPVRIHLVVRAGRRAPRLDGVRVTRSRTLTPADRRSLDGIWVATPERALLDAAARLGRARLRVLLIDARQRRVVMVGEVARRALATRRTPGRGRLLVACADVDGSAADSALVAEVERRLRDEEGIDLDVPPRIVTAPWRDLHPDLTVAGLPVAVEVDGFGFHAGRVELDLDQRKHNAYQLAGWTVLRVSWTRLEEDWAGFVAELKAAIAAAAAAAAAVGSP